ncbi:MAG: hypothetical protein QXR53_00345 [Candidatus Norongarragalinales archaeon]
MDYSVSDAVSEVLSEMHFLRFSLQEDLLNYSALARFLQPFVEAKVGGEAGQDAIVLAVKKYRESLPKDAFHVFKILAQTKIFLRTGMSLIHFSRTYALHKKLIDFQHNIDWASGEKMYLLQRSEEISVVALSKYERDLLALGKGQVLKDYSNLALVTVHLPKEQFDSFGVLEYLARQFSDLGVSIKEVFSSHDKVSFLFEGSKASQVYEKLSNAVKASREFVAEKAKG